MTKSGHTRTGRQECCLCSTGRSRLSEEELAARVDFHARLEGGGQSAEREHFTDDTAGSGGIAVQGGNRTICIEHGADTSLACRFGHCRRRTDRGEEGIGNDSHLHCTNSSCSDAVKKKPCEEHR